MHPHDDLDETYASAVRSAGSCGEIEQEILEKQVMTLPTLTNQLMVSMGSMRLALLGMYGELVEARQMRQQMLNELQAMKGGIAELESAAQDLKHRK